MILNANGKIDAMSVIKGSGFNDTTPEVSLCTNKVFQKNNVKYRFIGWCQLKGRDYTAVELCEVII